MTKNSIFATIIILASVTAFAQTEPPDERMALLRRQFQAAGPLKEANRKELKSGEGWVCVSPIETIQQIRANVNLSAWRERVQQNPDLKFDVSCLHNQLRTSAKDLDLSTSGFIQSGDLALTRNNFPHHLYLRITPEGLMIGEFTKPASPQSPMRSFANSDEEVFNYFLCVPEDQLAAPMSKMPATDSDDADKECSPIS